MVGEPERTAWLREHFGTTEVTAHTSDSSNPDQDGVINFLEYALELSPTLHKAYPPGLTPTSAPLSLTFKRARASLASTVRASSDLVVGEDLATNPGNVGHFITYLDSPPLGATQRFVCLRITTPTAGLP